jgi:hypothetical protein
MAVLGQSTSSAFGSTAAPVAPPVDKVPGISDKAAAWLKKHSITPEQLDHVFSIDSDSIEIIAAKMPGKGNSKQTLEAYMLCGFTSFLKNGDVNFTDKEARDLCQKIGCYDARNHAKNMKAIGNLVGGTKDTSWKLTNPGLNEVARIIKALVPAAHA